MGGPDVPGDRPSRAHLLLRTARPCDEARVLVAEQVGLTSCTALACLRDDEQVAGVALHLLGAGVECGRPTDPAVPERMTTVSPWPGARSARGRPQCPLGVGSRAGPETSPT